MTFFKKIAKFILDIDDTETSDQELFLKDLYSTQKDTVKPLDKKHIASFIKSLMEKHDILEFGLMKNKQIIAASKEFNKEDMLKFYVFFESIKGNIKDRIILLRDNPWINIFEKEGLVFLIKKDVKLTEFEINAIAYDVLNTKELFPNEKLLENQD